MPEDDQRARMAPKLDTDAIKGKVGENLRETLDQLPVSYELATIKCDVDLDIAIDDLIKQPEDHDALVALFVPGFWRR